MEFRRVLFRSATVEILAGIGVDAATRASALIAVRPEAPDGTAGARHDSLRREFGPEVVSLVQGTRALLRLGERAGQSSDSAASSDGQKEMQRKMLVAMAAHPALVLMRSEEGRVGEQCVW